ncbi:oligosaccharide flippase family protein [Acidimicrobiaceae bacterium USS-CC1]|uniref:Oligosaccharide flippase family protein n=1 Tax=Acidiferrimicrobium australe TaxID=2664430 RepID=A0ABW9QPJ6_9ACTN|nr:oligosaccharide flippase family protein [Acidiferrimicrobium australe]
MEQVRRTGGATLHGGRLGEARRALAPTTLVERARSSPLALGGVAFVGASVAVNLSNFAFHAALSRLLGPAGYGALGSLLNTLVVLSVPLGALEAAVTRMVAARASIGSSAGCRRLSVQAVAVGALGSVVWAGLSPLVQGFLQLHSLWPVLLLGLSIVPMAVGAVWQGVLVGEQRFRTVAVAQVLGSGAARLAMGVLLVSAGLGVSGAVLATVTAGVVTLAVLLPSVRSRLTSADTGALTAGDAAWTIASLGGVATLTSLDTWLGRHFLSPLAAGYFTAAATAGRIALFLPGTIILVFFPGLVKAAGRTAEAHTAIGRALIWVGACALVGVAVLVGASGLVVGVLFGAQFTPAVPVVRVLAAADGMAALISTLVYFQLARRSRLAIAGWAGCVLMAGLAALWHGSTQQLAWTMLAADAATLVTLGAASTLQVRRDRRRLAAGPGPAAAGGRRAATFPALARDRAVP